MGCCISRTAVDDTIGPDGTVENPIPRGGNKPFTKKGVSWKSDSPITQYQLKKQREEFWDTAPSYEGRLEIWQALRMTCDSDDLVFAQTILDSVNITIPTGNLADGCYDELGNRYVIPPYCLVNPTNLIKSSGDEDEGTSYQADDMEAKLLADQQSTSTATLHSITVRISNTAKDVQLNIDLQLETIATLRQKLLIHEALDPKKNRIRFFFLGQLLEEKLKLSEVKFDDARVLQAQITEK